jgi:hypothetical protein
MATKTPKSLADAGLKIYSTGEDREEWLGQRRGKYTATTVTAIVGSNPYTKLIDVWNDFTDPEYDGEELRNRWLEERAAFGQQREPEIIKWASADPLTGGEGNPFIPSTALVGLPEHEAQRFTSTPDGYKFAREGVLVLIECKASQQNWEKDGVPQHIYDQCQWQIYTTGAVTVWLAQELVKWVGRGANKQAEVIGRYLVPIRRDDARLAWMLAKVEWFEGLLTEGIAPESDIDLRELEAPEFDATEEEMAEWAQLTEADALLTELAEIRERAKLDADRDAVIVDLLKPIAKQFEGRRIWLIGTRFTAKLVRGTRAVVNTKALPLDTQRSITSWAESETVKFEPNPEYVAPATANNESE